MMSSAPAHIRDLPLRASGEKRAYVRHVFRGETFTVRLGERELELRLKDLSCGGACGLLEEPLAIGDYVVVELEPTARVEAQVCWVRRVWVGLQFSNPISPVLIARLCEKFAPQPEDDATSPRSAGRARTAAGRLNHAPPKTNRGDG